MNVLHLPLALQQRVEEVNQQVFVDFLPEDALEAHVGEGVDELSYGFLLLYSVLPTKIMQTERRTKQTRLFLCRGAVYLI